MSEQDVNLEEKRKLELEVETLRRDLDEAGRPFWQQRGFARFLIPIIATLFVSAASLAYQVYDEHFSEMAEVTLSEAQLDELLRPLRRKNLELSNEKLVLENEKLTFENEEKRGIRAALDIENKALTTNNEQLMEKLKDKLFAISRLNEQISSIRQAGQIMVSVHAVLAAYTDICRASENPNLRGLQRQIVPIVLETDRALSGFEQANADEFDSRLPTSKCEALVRTTETARVWIGEPECLAKWHNHIEARRLEQAVRLLQNAPGLPPGKWSSLK